MPAPAESDRDARWDASAPIVDRACLALALAVTLAWFSYYQQQPGYLCDEGGHIGNVYHFLEGKSGWPEAMTMLPGYHFLVASLWQLHPPITLLTLARLVSAVLSCGGLLAFAVAWRRLHPANPAAPRAPGAGAATLLLALFPVLLPFTGMAYTDGPALAFTLMALAAQLTGRCAMAASFFVFAIATRQTNLTWVGFAIAWEWLGARSARARGERDAFWRRTRWLWLLIIIGAVCVVLAGRVSVGTQTGTELRPNIATLHTAALLALLLGLPIWLQNAWPALRGVTTWSRTRPVVAVVSLLAAAGLVAVLTRTFANPHVWNRDLFWEGCSFTLLRNWPLVWIDSHDWLRVASSINVVLMAVSLAWMFQRQRLRAGLWLALAIGALLPAANNLVEPRYFIPAVVFVLLFLGWEKRAWWLIAGWWALLCAVHAPFVQRGLSLW